MKHRAAQSEPFLFLSTVHEAENEQTLIWTEDLYDDFMTWTDSELLVELTALSIFSEILISLCNLWSFKSVDISAEKRRKEDPMMEMV